jgi:HSP20 family molecular chaperone IbpA
MFWNIPQGVYASVSVFPDKIKAKFKEGVLEVEILEPEEEKPKPVTIDVE